MFDLQSWLTGFAPGVAGLPQPVVGGGEDKTLTVLGWLMGRQIAGQRWAQSDNAADQWESTITLTDEHKTPLIMYGLYSTELPAEFKIESGKTYALTVNGVRAEYTAEAVTFNGFSNEYIGNKYLGVYIWDSGTPDGPDYCFWSTYKDGHLKNTFSARSPGSYNVTVELVDKE